jgi:hypothetical protein
MQAPQHGDVDRAVGEIVEFATATRSRILLEQMAPSNTVKGVVADNFFEDPSDNRSIRRNLAMTSDIKINKPLTPDFNLFIKHPAIFTALAQPLEKEFPLYAIVRHPLAALASWLSVDIPVRNGRLPMAEAYAPALRALLDSIDDTLRRQVAAHAVDFPHLSHLAGPEPPFDDNPPMSGRPQSAKIILRDQPQTRVRQAARWR